MSAEQAPCFVDTNVLVYAFEKGGSPRKETAKRLVTELMDTDRLRLSTQVLQELFVILTRKAAVHCTGEEALGVLEDLAAWPLTVVDFPVIRAAAGLAGKASLSFWDSLVVISAAKSGSAVLYTEDLNDGQEILGVRVTNPFTS
jgi:predicted nucleic acid-binding protein